MKPTSPTSSSTSVPTTPASSSLPAPSTLAPMLASSSSGSHTPPPTRAGGVLKRLRQILWEGVGRDAPTAEESSALPLRPEPAASTATAPQPPPHTAAGTSRPAPTTSVAMPTRQATTTAVGPPTLHHEHLLKEALKRMNKHSPLQTRLALVNEVCEYSRSYRYAPRSLLGWTWRMICRFSTDTTYVPCMVLSCRGPFLLHDGAASTTC